MDSYHAYRPIITDFVRGFRVPRNNYWTAQLENWFRIYENIAIMSIVTRGVTWPCMNVFRENNVDVNYLINE